MLSLLCHLVLLLSGSLGALSTEIPEEGRKKILISEDTVWSLETLGKSSIALDRNVTVLPGATLSIEGSNRTDAPEDFVVIFLARNISIVLHGGARIRLTDATFLGNTTSPLGMGVQTMGLRNDHQEGLTIHATRFRCRGMVACLTAQGSMEVYDSLFQVHRSTSYAIKGTQVKVEGSTFRNTRASDCILRLAYYGHAEVSDSQFINEDQGLKLGTAVDTSSFAVVRCSFVGYDTALVASGDGGDLVQNCTFVGNRIAVEGNDNGYRSRGVVSGSYFWRNGLAQYGHDAQDNIYVENVVAYKMTRSASNLLLYKNVIGFWSPGDSTWDTIPSGANRKLANVTFLDNAVSTLGGVLIPPSASVNLLGSKQYHLNYSFSSPVNLTSGVYWSNDGTTRTASDAEARTKIRDGLDDNGGPGIVLINAASSPLEPYHHSNYPNKGYVPPGLEEWTRQMELPDISADPPLPTTKALHLPLEITEHSFSSWWEHDLGHEESQPPPSNEQQGGCSVALDDPKKVAAMYVVQRETATCAQLAKMSASQLDAWCSAPDSTAADACPVACCDTTTIVTSKSGVQQEKKYKKDLSECNCTVPEGSHLWSGIHWSLVVLLVVYLLVLHVMAFSNLRHWLTPNRPYSTVQTETPQA